MSTPRHTLFLVAALAATVAQSAPSAELARCAAIASPETRLACYDALAGRAPDGHPSLPVTATAVAPPAAARPAPDPVRDFGLSKAQTEKSQPDAAPSGPAEVRAVVTSIGGAGGQTLVTLDNGQTWSFADDDGRLSTGDTVTIRKAALGAFKMITPSHHTYYVHRTR